MTHERHEDVSPLAALCATVERELPEDASWSVRRPCKDGWCMLGGPTCTIFVGESLDADGRPWVTFGPVARRTEITGDGRETREEFTYLLRETDRRPLSDIPLAPGVQPEEARELLDELHARVVEGLGDDALLYDGWIVWGWESARPWPTVPGLAGPR